jgi:phosphonate transport system permease protein
MEQIRQFITFQRKNILTVLLTALFIWSLFSVNWNEDLVHSGGMVTIKQVVIAIFQPNLTSEIIQLAFESTLITLAYAVAGMSLAILIAFIFGILASGILQNSYIGKIFSKGLFRGLLGFLRSIHELVWALIFVATFGLSPIAAILAIAIPYGGILGRIFADMLNDVQEEPIASLRTTGATKLQCLFYGYFPIVRSNMISYTMYRFECAIRSSAIMSFVGLGGLGYQIQLSLDDLKYDEVWTFLYFLIVIVVLVDVWSTLIRKAFNKPSNRLISWNQFSSFTLFLLLIGSWLYIILVDKMSVTDLFSEKNAYYAKKFFGGLLGFGEENPAFLSTESWQQVLLLSYETLEMSIMAIGFSTIVMFLTVIPAASNIANGSLTLNRKWYHAVSYGVIRLLYIFSRAVPELIWAMIIVFIFKPGILPGAIALALHNFGILGKLCAEVIEEIDERPIRNLRSSGASNSQLLLYGVLPTVMPQFLTYILYRWEVIMRTTIVVGFVGAGGLGQHFRLSLSFFHYTDITLILICYCFLVIIADFISEATRRAAK